MRERTRRWVLATGAVAVVGIVTAAVVTLTAEGGTSTPAKDAPSAADTARQFLLAFAGGDAAAAAAHTDDPAAARRVLADAHSALRPERLTARLTTAPTGDTPGTATLTWTFGPDTAWTYDTRLELAEGERGWRVHWSPALVHPSLGAGQRLALRTGGGGPAVVDRAGTPLLTWQGTRAVPAGGVSAPVLLPAMARVAGERAATSWSVDLVDTAGTVVETLRGPPPEDGAPLTATIGLPVQRAAQSAVDGAGRPALLVALQPSTGDLLAVAQSPEVGADPRALSGLYPPGSTFKIATATAVLARGAATADTVLPCPSTTTVGTRTIPNDDRFDLGPVPLHRAFAASCNTTFGRLASELPADALAGAADQLGLNADFAIPGIDTEAGTVRPTGDPVQRLEDGIGQGDVVASPFGLALMAATVAAGEAVTPRLWRELDTTVNEGYSAPPQRVLRPLRGMMREVVTGGTATELRNLGQVSGKTGTAQYDTGVHAHGWFAGFRGDLAFAVLVPNANTSDPAVAVTARFLRDLPR
ncbi:NTF2-like N-terminal transpeptidase domain-containing protein [Amycolatopsis arida]|uniref:NTF2-like N-terminal transpeptidase domain-containing protein n=1 Tax=Amycolatopsis arida TaxID=587909 RepID=A0A1I5XJG4_9PSEU|nr:penicillin-binding transpeptidase domain-containing protein [Amycolatopsis arida]TDX97416.1 MecA-like transpeptidase family protein [Amycolatopsis arida]SFQ31946.1 NTF2-like N-terminal transpeptidase domain-containing protein [Amycolatopsis arida]